MLRHASGSDHRQTQELCGGDQDTGLRFEHRLDLFQHCRYNTKDTEKRKNRNQAFAAWQGLTCAKAFGLQTG
jgi:hypothetical protein